MPVDRTDPPAVADERTMLETWLDYHRATLLMKCDGLSDDQLRQRAVPPSTMSLLGLVRHMTEVERWWFTAVLGHGPMVYRYCSDENRDGDFDDVDDADVEGAFVGFAEECEASRRAVAAVDSLDFLGLERHHDKTWDISLRWILVHMIEEYARHNGHADLLRERIDGVTGD